MEEHSRNTGIKSRSSRDTEKQIVVFSSQELDDSFNNQSNHSPVKSEDGQLDHDESAIIFRTVEEELKDGIYKLKQKFNTNSIDHELIDNNSKQTEKHYSDPALFNLKERMMNPLPTKIPKITAKLCKTNRPTNEEELQQLEVNNTNSAREHDENDNKENVHNLSIRYLQRVSSSNSSLKDANSSNLSSYRENKTASVGITNVQDTFEYIKSSLSRNYSKESIGKTEKKIIGQYPYQFYNQHIDDIDENLDKKFKEHTGVDTKLDGVPLSPHDASNLFAAFQINTFDDNHLAQTNLSMLKNVEPNSEMAINLNSLYETRALIISQINKQLSSSVSKIELTKAQLSNLRKKLSSYHNTRLMSIKAEYEVIKLELDNYLFNSLKELNYIAHVKDISLHDMYVDLDQMQEVIQNLLTENHIDLMKDAENVIIQSAKLIDKTKQSLLENKSIVDGVRVTTNIEDFIDLPPIKLN